jgi:PAS domain S-box-containing protein
VVSSFEALQQFLSEKTTRLLDCVFDGVYIVDTARRIVFWNKGAEAITGYSAAEVIGHSCKDNILNHINEEGVLLCRTACPLVRAIQTDSRIEEKVFPLHKDGRRVPVSTHVAPIKNEAGRIIGAIEVFRDIAAEEELRIVQAKFEKLIRQYVSETTYETIMASISKDVPVSAVSKDLTVFFLDIVGFTALAEKRRPEEVVRLLNLCFSLATQIVKQHAGDVDKFLGDGVLAVFIDARDAVNAAVSFLENGLSGLNQTLDQKGLPPIEVRIGINSGRLVHGDIGSEERKDLTVIGDAVNTAKRIQEQAEPGTFLISESTYARLRDQHAFEFSLEISLRGKAEPIRLFRFKG